MRGAEGERGKERERGIGDAGGKGFRERRSCLAPTDRHVV